MKNRKYMLSIILAMFLTTLSAPTAFAADPQGFTDSQVTIDPSLYDNPLNLKGANFKQSSYDKLKAALIKIALVFVVLKNIFVF